MKIDKSKFRKFFGCDAKTVWVDENIYEYGMGCPELIHGSFRIKQSGKVTSHYNGTMNSGLEQLRDRAKRMSFANGFWFLREKSKNTDYYFHYEKKV